MNIFYDNAQKIYERALPTWSALGLDRRGRSTVMKERFRSTPPVTEYALNVLYRLQLPCADPDHKELLDRGRVERTQRECGPWWNVRFNQVDSPSPTYKKYSTLAKQVSSIAEQVFRWVENEGVRPRDICVLSNDKYHGERMAAETSQLLKKIGAQALLQTGRAFDPDDRTVTVTTTQSFAGYDAEVVVIGGVERFIAQRQILPNNHYVAMTRARSVLAIYAYQQENPRPEARTILSTLQQCIDALLDRPQVDQEISNLDDFEDVLGRLGDGADTAKRDWLAKLWKSYLIPQKPIMASAGEILPEPLF